MNGFTPLLGIMSPFARKYSREKLDLSRLIG